MINTTKRKKESKQVGLFQLWREIFIARRQVREIEEAKREFGKNLMISKEASDPIMRLKHLDDAEKNFNKAKELIYQIKERQTSLFSREIGREDISTESQFEEMGAYFSGLRLINKIAVEGYVHGGAIEKWTELLTWFGFDNPKVAMSFTIRKLWKVIVIKDPAYRQLDDLPPDIIKRQQGIRKVLEQMGGKFYYNAMPSFGTRITVMIPTKEG